MYYIFISNIMHKWAPHGRRSVFFVFWLVRTRSISFNCNSNGKKWSNLLLLEANWCFFDIWWNFCSKLHKNRVGTLSSGFFNYQWCTLCAITHKFLLWLFISCIPNIFAQQISSHLFSMRFYLFLRAIFSYEILSQLIWFHIQLYNNI